jgi:hypothetical protein
MRTRHRLSSAIAADQTLVPAPKAGALSKTYIEYIQSDGGYELPLSALLALNHSGLSEA